MLEVNNVSYKVKKFELNNISFSLEAGYLMCLLGKNGAGKTTLLKLLYGLMPVNNGSIKWNDNDIYKNSVEVRQEVAYIAEETGFFEMKNIKENVEMLSSLYTNFNKEKWEIYVEKFSIDQENKEKKFSEFSTGQRKLIQIAFALSRDPKLLILDEPDANLDPVFRIELMEILQELIAEENISIIISTHIFDEIEEIADYIGVMKSGELKMFGDRESIFFEHNKDSLEELIIE